MKPLVALAKAIGTKVKLITADEGYNDCDGSFYKEAGVHLITTRSSKVSAPEHVDPEIMEVLRIVNQRLSGCQISSLRDQTI